MPERLIIWLPPTSSELEPKGGFVVRLSAALPLRGLNLVPLLVLLSGQLQGVLL